MSSIVAGMEATDDTKTNELVARRARVEQMDEEIYEERKRAELTIVREIARLVNEGVSIPDLTTALHALRPMGITSAPTADVVALRHRVEVAALTTLEKFLPHTNTQHASEALAALAQHPR